VEVGGLARESGGASSLYRIKGFPCRGVRGSNFLEESSRRPSKKKGRPHQGKKGEKRLSFFLGSEREWLLSHLLGKEQENRGEVPKRKEGRVSTLSQRKKVSLYDLEVQASLDGEEPVKAGEKTCKEKERRTIF